MYLLDVYIGSPNLSIDYRYTYASQKKVLNHTRVRVTFNKRSLLGFVDKVEEFDGQLEELNAKLGYEVRYIEEVVDQEVIITNEQYDLAKWLKKVTLAPFIQCLNTILPKALKTAKEKVSHKEEQFIRLNSDLDISLLTKRQAEILGSLSEGMSLSEARQLSRAIINKLIEKGYIEVSGALKIKKAPIKYSAFKDLTPDQMQVYEGILKEEKMISLLYGVTGSGKSEVFFYLAKKMIEEGKQVLILVPEIGLTSQMVKNAQEHFENIAIYHSYLSDLKRYKEYQKVLNDEVDLIIGTRSSVFLPLKRLGLIIVDEEHDHSYKQDSSPCYSAKNVAFKLAYDKNAKVLLASATPALDTYTRALRKEYGYYELNKRINPKPLDLEIIDLNEEIKKGSMIIPDSFKEAILKCHHQNEQAIILLNRRGYAPIIKCEDCHEILMCHDCDVALTYHQDLDKLKCHVCGRLYDMPKRCPKCGSYKLRRYGFGTKRVVEELLKIDHTLRIVRMDADNINSKNPHEAILNDFAEGNYDILVGTQMVAKGLDFERVALVGILNADAGLLRDDFNSCETTFDLLMQASGRSGRKDLNGKVLIAAYNPDHYVLEAVRRQDYYYFYKREMLFRQRGKYPPYTHLIAFFLRNKNEKALFKDANELYEGLKELGLKVYAPYHLGKQYLNYRARVLVKEGHITPLLEVLNEFMHDFASKHHSSLKVDFDPYYLE